MRNKTITAEELLATLSNTILDLEAQEIREHNRNFNRQIAKAKEIGNIAGKMIALTGQQLYAVELGAEVSVPLLGIINLSSNKPTMTEKTGKSLKSA